MKRIRDVKEACVGEALAIVASQGIEKLSLRDVSRRLGLSHQAPYRHFPSRDHLLAEIVARAYRAFAEVLTRARDEAEPGQALAAMGIAYLDHARREPLAYRLMFETPLPSAEAHPAMMTEARQAFDLLLDALRRERAAAGGVFSAPGISGVGKDAAGSEPAGTDPLGTGAVGTDPDDLLRRDALYVWSALHGFASIRASSAVETLALSPLLMEAMVQHMLDRIGAGLPWKQGKV